MNDQPPKPFLSPEMMKALGATLPNFHEMWRRYNDSGFRRACLMEWAGDDPEKIAQAEELLARK